MRDDELWVFYRGVNCTKKCTSWYGNVEHLHEVIRKNGGEDYCQRWKSMHGHPWDGRTASIGLPKIRLDGFVSLDADKVEGVLTTRAMKFDGKRLLINAMAKGRIAVEMLGDGDRPVEGLSSEECDALCGDDTAHVVTWRGRSDLSKLSRKTVRLRFRARDAKLYSFVFAS